MNNGESEIDSQEFFLASNGKKDAEAELNATLTALYNEKRFDDNSSACRYPARTVWLQKKLNLKNLVQTECKKFNGLMLKLDPKSATLVFPNAHINSPASMFGHTFLRIDSSYFSKLLSYAVNYSADANSESEGNGAMYAIKGIFGGYAGYYSLLAYTDKLKEYRDTDRRDIWEYELNLTEEETKLMMYHIWELNRAYSWYYFFRENCSYNMLWLLEIARPSVHLRDKFTYFVTPPATIQAIYEENLIDKQKYRPSKRTTILSYEKKLGYEKIAYSKKIALNELTPEAVLDLKVSKQDKQYILEASALLLEYYYLDAEIGQKDYAEKLHAILSLRAKLGTGKELNIIRSQNPDDAHKTSRVKIETLLRNSKVGVVLGVRPSYHSLDDFNLGFLPGTQIEFFNAELLAYNSNEIELEKLALLSIKSYTQLSSLFHNIAYELSAGWNQNSLENGAHFSLDGGFGVSVGNNVGYTYVLSTYSSYIGGVFKHSLSASLGAKVGIVAMYFKNFQSRVELQERLTNELNKQLLVHFSEVFRVKKNFTISLMYDYIEKKRENQKSLKVGLNYYF